jgi:hypothetical protein
MINIIDQSTNDNIPMTLSGVGAIPCFGKKHSRSA